MNVLREREAAGLSRERLAQDLNVSVDKLRRWEEGAKLPTRREEEIRWYLAMARAEKLADDAGLARCPVVEDFELALEQERSPDEVIKQVEELERHSSSCDVCTARAAFSRKHGPPIPPMPKGSWRERADSGLFAFLGYLFGEKGLTPWLMLGGLAGLVGLIHYLPHWNGFLVFLYPASLVLGGSVGYRLYRTAIGSVPSNWLTRWLARSVAGVAACWVFVSVYMVSGYSSILNRQETASPWTEELLIATILGLGYALLWPLAKVKL